MPPAVAGAALTFFLTSLLLSPSTAADAITALHIAHQHSPLAASPAAALASDATRFLSLLAAGRSFVPVASGRRTVGSMTYVVRALVGTPPQPLLLAVDPSNDAAWLPCSGCAGCSSPAFNPSLSSTHRPVPCGSPECALVPPATPSCAPPSCGFNLSYASSTLEATLVQDSISVAADVVEGYTFGCLKSVAGDGAPPQGLLGLGRGPLSFMSQTKGMYSGVFSYCLPAFTSANFSGTLRLGRAGQPTHIRAAALLANPHRPSLYYVNMTGIRVGSRFAAVPPSSLAFDPATGGGTIVDAGTMFTLLAAPAYTAVRDAFRRRVAAPLAPPLGGFDTCYAGKVAIPTVSFVFDGGKASMTLPEENVMIHSAAGVISCLAMAAAPAEGLNAAVNVVGAMQQQNHRVVLDAPGARVGIARELCTSPAW